MRRPWRPAAHRPARRTLPERPGRQDVAWRHETPDGPRCQPNGDCLAPGGLPLQWPRSRRRVVRPRTPQKRENPALCRAFASTATGIRTPVSAVRGRRPSPLDDGGSGAVIVQAVRRARLATLGRDGASPRQLLIGAAGCAAGFLVLLAAIYSSWRVRSFDATAMGGFLDAQRPCLGGLTGGSLTSATPARWPVRRRARGDRALRAASRATPPRWSCLLAAHERVEPAAQGGDRVPALRGAARRWPRSSRRLPERARHRGDDARAVRGAGGAGACAAAGGACRARCSRSPSSYSVVALAGTSRATWPAGSCSPPAGRWWWSAGCRLAARRWPERTVRAGARAAPSRARRARRGGRALAAGRVAALWSAGLVGGARARSGCPSSSAGRRRTPLSSSCGALGDGAPRWCSPASRPRCAAASRRPRGILAPPDQAGGQGKSGARPARTRHCDRGSPPHALTRAATGSPTAAREGAASGPGSQETCPRRQAEALVERGGSA